MSGYVCLATCFSPGELTTYQTTVFSVSAAPPAPLAATGASVRRGILAQENWLHTWQQSYLCQQHPRQHWLLRARLCGGAFYPRRIDFIPDYSPLCVSSTPGSTGCYGRVCAAGHFIPEELTSYLTTVLSVSAAPPAALAATGASVRRGTPPRENWPPLPRGTAARLSPKS